MNTRRFFKSLDNYWERAGYMTSEFVTMKLYHDQHFSTIRLYAGYIAAAFERKMEKPDMDAILAGLI